MMSEGEGGWTCALCATVHTGEHACLWITLPPKKSTIYVGCESRARAEWKNEVSADRQILMAVIDQRDKAEQRAVDLAVLLNRALEERDRALAAVRTLQRQQEKDWGR